MSARPYIVFVLESNQLTEPITNTFMAFHEVFAAERPPMRVGIWKTVDSGHYTLPCGLLLDSR